MIRLMRILLLSLLAWSSVTASATTTPSGCVVLVHGLAGQGWNWWRLAPLLEQHGYQVVKARYRSRQLTITQAAPALSRAIEQCPPHLPVSLVGHSLGGILIRQYLTQPDHRPIHRVVMLGTPNRGSHLAVDRNRKYWHEQWIARLMGPVVAQLQATPDSAVNQLPAISVPTGVIAGYLTPAPWLTKRFDHLPNDGLVATEYTKVAGMQDFVYVKTTHMSLPFDVNAQRQVLWFVQTGRFFHPSVHATTVTGADP